MPENSVGAFMDTCEARAALTKDGGELDNTEAVGGGQTESLDGAGGATADSVLLAAGGATCDPPAAKYTGGGFAVLWLYWAGAFHSQPKPSRHFFWRTLSTGSPPCIKSHPCSCAEVIGYAWRSRGPATCSFIHLLNSVASGPWGSHPWSAGSKGFNPLFWLGSICPGLNFIGTSRTVTALRNENVGFARAFTISSLWILCAHIRLSAVVGTGLPTSCFLAPSAMAPSANWQR
mmetsp:Transcript_94550/g.267104  ORF Transcript_94550/g.267104 Transcript_94550/m.267104 type:complete len:233 (-) Transcript_94550:38-736(-)